MATKKTTAKKTTTKKSTSASKTNLNLIKAEALKKIVEHNRDYLKLDLTLPLGDTALKKVHTNQWLFTDLPKEFDLANWTILAKALNSNTNRFEGYVENRWYIESVDITCDAGSGKYEMKLGLNAFASSYSGYLDNLKNFESNYTTATTKTKSAAKDTSNAVTTGDNSTLKKNQTKLINDLVTKIVGTETDELKKAKLVHQWLKENVRYTRYCCAKYKNVDDCYNNRRSLNCADTATLTCRMMLAAGLNAYIVHRSHANGHFWTVIEIGGTKYVSDQTGDGSEWNTVWYSAGNRGSPGSSGGNWDSKNGDFPDCYPAYSC